MPAQLGWVMGSLPGVRAPGRLRQLIASSLPALRAPQQRRFVPRFGDLRAGPGKGGAVET